MDTDENYLHGDIEQAFRWIVMHTKGWKKGNIREAKAEAITDYINKYKNKVPPMPKKVIPSEPVIEPLPEPESTK